MADAKRAIEYLLFLLHDQFGLRTMPDGKSIYCVSCLNASDGITDIASEMNDPTWHATDCPVRNAIEWLNEQEAEIC